MWVILKVKNKEFSVLRESFLKTLGKDVEFYLPKIKIQKFQKNKVKNYETQILGDYIFCYHEKLRSLSFLQSLKGTKGLKYFLENSIYNQNQIKSFINNCRENEKEGFISQTFFSKIINQKAIFISGPFTNMIFKIVSEHKNKLKIIVGDLKTTISKNAGYLYQSA